MQTHILDLPDELIETIISYLIGEPWLNDVEDLLSFTSTCQRFHRFAKEEKFWRKLTKRRDPTHETSIENPTWFDCCKQIYLMRTIPLDAIQEKISRFNDDYYCTIEKLIIWPDKIRIHINERGDYSLGSIQHPRFSVIAFIEDEHDDIDENEKLHVLNSEFSIEDENSQYLGYLDFQMNFPRDSNRKQLVFQYGFDGYSTIKLFQIDESFIDKFNLPPLMRRRENIV